MTRSEWKALPLFRLEVVGQWEVRNSTYLYTVELQIKSSKRRYLRVEDFYLPPGHAVWSDGPLKSNYQNTRIPNIPTAEQAIEIGKIIWGNYGTYVLGAYDKKPIKQLIYLEM